MPLMSATRQSEDAAATVDSLITELHIGAGSV
jgi:hypothetical protein